MRCKDSRDAVKTLNKIPGPWIPGYWALIRGKEKRDVNLSKAGKK